jgi:hypothetical protein
MHMRFRPLLMLAVFALAASVSVRAQDQQKEQQVIDDFVTTRGVSFDTPGKKPPQKQGAQSPTPHRSNAAATGKSSGLNSGGVASNKSPAGKSPSTVKSNKGGARTSEEPEVTAQAEGSSDAGAQMLNASAEGPAVPRPIALGYTILMKDDSGRLSVVEPERSFKTGDRIAVVLETNANGYLYMFNASDGKNPELLFPSPQLESGVNALQAHARATFPTDLGHDFRFTDPPAAEHLFVIFSREPLAGVPTGEALIKFCGTNQDDCSWKPTAAQWERIKGSVKGRGVTEAKNTQLAQAALPVMPDTLARGLKVKREDPKPAVVRVNNSADASVLVTEIVLTHK